ncbi:MAG: MFS transporter, partial [Anaerobiospirillum succiniciproducens]
MADKRSFLALMRSMGKEYYILSLMMYFFFISWAGCYSLLAVWLKEFFKLSGSEIGFAYAVFSVTALCLSPVYGMLQ